MFPTWLRQLLSVLAIVALFAGQAMLTATTSAAEDASAKTKKAAKSRQSDADARIKARAAEAKKRRAAKAKKAKSKKSKKAKAKKRKRMSKKARAKAKKRKTAKPKTAKPKTAKPKMAKPKMENKDKPEMAKPAPETSGDKQTQTALSVRPSVKLARLVRKIQDEMQAGEADGSLTKGELARLASLKERVEIMDRMSRNDHSFSAWELRYLETANTILRNIIQRRRLDGVMSVEPRHLEMRIQRGLQDGTLTEQQAENLREIQRQILVVRNEADQDGSLSPKEKARYLRAQYRLSDLVNHTRRYGPIARTLGQSRFKDALERGVRNGAFSRSEARSLWRTHQRIVNLREKAISDGKITSVELTVLNKRLKAERHRLSYGERAAYRRSLRVLRGSTARVSRGSGGDDGASARRGAGAVRNYGRALGGGMRSLGRTFGGR